VGGSRQQIDDLAALKVADHDAVAMAAPPGPVVDADHPRGTGRRPHRVADATQKSVLADRQEQSCAQGPSRAPPRARPGWRTRPCRRPVRHAYGWAIAGENRSTKIRVRHCEDRHRKRRAFRMSLACRRGRADPRDNAGSGYERAEKSRRILNRRPLRLPPGVWIRTKSPTSSIRSAFSPPGQERPSIHLRCHRQPPRIAEM
jgi:hypothetical protein